MKTSIKSLVIGPPGSGKTYHGATYPKSYWISTEPGGFETVEMELSLIKNVVKQNYFIPSPIKDVKDVFKEIQDSCVEAHNMYKDGKIYVQNLSSMIPVHILLEDIEQLSNRTMAGYLFDLEGIFFATKSLNHQISPKRNY